MTKFDFLQFLPLLTELIQVLVPFISALLLFYLASNKEQRISKHDVYKQRLENYYIPFYKMYCRGLLSEYPLSDMPLENRCKFLDLFSKNLQYMDAKSQSLYFTYYKAFLNLTDAENSTPENLDKCKQDFSVAFSAISDSTFAEYKYLLRKLKMPVPNI